MGNVIDNHNLAMERLLAKDGLPEYVNSVLEEGVVSELKVFISTSFNIK